MRIRRVGWSLPIVLALTAGCSSPSAPSSTPAATAPSATLQSVVNTSLSSVAASYNAMRSGTRSLGLGAPVGAGVQFPSLVGLSTQCNSSGSSCSVQFNESDGPRTTACQGGGSTTMSSTMTGVIQGSATSMSGSLNLSIRETRADCGLPGAVINSNPSTLTSGTVYITSQHTRLNLMMSGTFVATNPPGTPSFRVSCTYNAVLLQWDDITGNWANSGSVDCNNGVSFKL